MFILNFDFELSISTFILTFNGNFQFQILMFVRKDIQLVAHILETHLNISQWLKLLLDNSLKNLKTRRTKLRTTTILPPRMWNAYHRAKVKYHYALISLLIFLF